MRKKAPSFNFDMILCECILESHDKHIMTTICYTILWQKGGENCFQENANIAGAPSMRTLATQCQKRVEEKMISTSKTVLKSEGRRIETSLSVKWPTTSFSSSCISADCTNAADFQQISRRWNDIEIVEFLPTHKWKRLNRSCDPLSQ